MFGLQVLLVESGLEAFDVDASFLRFLAGSRFN
jgi:hypothetical protein